MTLVPVKVACESEDGPAELSPRRGEDDIKTFVAAIAIVLRESVAGFESTVSRVTEITVHRPGRADRDLVVALQDFDRLQQEFATLGEVLARISTASSDGAQAEQGASDGLHPVLSDISIADLKDRLSRQLRSMIIDPLDVDTSEEVEF